MNEPEWVGVVLVSEDDKNYTLKNLKEFVNGQKVGPEFIEMPKEHANFILENNHNYQRDLLVSKEVALREYPDYVWVSVREL